MCCKHIPRIGVRPLVRNCRRQRRSANNYRSCADAVRLHSRTLPITALRPTQGARWRHKISNICVTVCLRNRQPRDTCASKSLLCANAWLGWKCVTKLSCRSHIHKSWNLNDNFIGKDWFDVYCICVGDLLRNKYKPYKWKCDQWSWSLRVLVNVSALWNNPDWIIKKKALR